MDLTKAPKGATHWAPDTGQWCECWYRLENGKWFVINDYWASDVDREGSPAGDSWYNKSADKLVRPMADLVEIPKVNKLVEVEGKRIIGSVNGMAVISLDWSNGGECYIVGSSTCLPTDIKLAALYLECYTAVFATLADLKSYKRGDYVQVTGEGAFSRGSKGVVEFVEPNGNVWVLRDGAGSPCFFLPAELTKIASAK